MLDGSVTIFDGKREKMSHFFGQKLAAPWLSDPPLSRHRGRLEGIPRTGSRRRRPASATSRLNGELKGMPSEKNQKKWRENSIPGGSNGVLRCKWISSSSGYGAHFGDD